jgi:hypothetical protein
MHAVRSPCAACAPLASSSETHSAADLALPVHRSGRKKAALIYVVTYALSCATKHSPDFGVLMVRDPGGGGPCPGRNRTGSRGQQ